MIDFTVLSSFVHSLNNHGLHFLFSDRIKHQHDKETIQQSLQDSIKCFQQTNGIESIFQRLLHADNVDIGLKIENIEKFLIKSGLPQNIQAGINNLLEVVLAMLLHQMARDKNRSAHPQNLRHVLSYFSQKKPEFLLIVESLLQIIPDHDDFAIEERGRASRTLVNNFKIETLFIYTSQDPNLTENQKQFIFSWLNAFQKVYRKIQEILTGTKKEKVEIAKNWFGKSLSQLKQDGEIPKADYLIPVFINNTIECLLKGNDEALQKIGRGLVLSVNNEDILRIMHGCIQENSDLLQDAGSINKLYHQIYLIMQEYREICTAQRDTHYLIKDTMSAISQQRRVTELIISSEHKQENKTLILGKKYPYELLDETRQNLEESNLQHLYEIWPIPLISQEVFNSVCKLKYMIPQGKDYIINHYLYREKLLEFLMRLERVGIKIIKDPDIALITNSVQLNSINYFNEGVYLGSTGHWNSQNQKPPSVICCTNPYALGNCHGHMLRHVCLRVFLGTGEFYESPFILDSTQRFGQIDEEAGIDALIMRPGLFLIQIPALILDQWKSVQKNQLKSKLNKIIDIKINKERAFSG
ncbi:MAG: hypothetical protein KKH68_12730 [Proteobacteria bacterium]|nr:hypothetical protein [Pseudomonadota bacterium]